MELIKKNIHMDRIRAQAVSQITLEEDMNIPDQKPDVSSLCFDQASVMIDEVKPCTDYVQVRGRLCFAVLYHTQEEGCGLVALDGKLPFEEKINMQGVQSSDLVQVQNTLEDLSTGIINSRKFSIQAVLTISAQVQELYDEEAPIGLYGEDGAEYRRTPVEVAQIAICKNDIFRVKEEITLPTNYPNMFQILWSSVTLNDVECKPLEEKLSLQGDVHLFLLYEGEGEEHPVRSFETTLPFSGVMDCHGSRDVMIPDIQCIMSQQELDIRPDLDGEERVIGLEVVLDIGIRLYEEEQTELITDIYGVTRELTTISKPASLRRLLSRVNGKMKVNDHIRIQKREAGILQLLHSQGTVQPDRQEVTEAGLELWGSLQVKVLYITGADDMPYAGTTAQIPYHYTLEIPGLGKEDLCDVRCSVEQLQVTMLDGEEMDVKAVLVFGTIAFRSMPLELIGDVLTAPLDTHKLGALPGMTIYVVKPGDNLWNIGKRYYLPVDRLRELNELSNDELTPGQKLLVVKGGI
ncbi:MAG: DUF3794 domain-containing protein [Lachnospiraceae bacterium]|nr:DUF3794 domain-containing protein [Lachnospiraceae bacterium]